jgi:hypothetical protein
MLNPQRQAMHRLKAKKSHLGRPSGSRRLSFFLKEELNQTVNNKSRSEER